MNDIEKILIRAKAGDKDAFALIYKEYYVPIYRYIHTRIRNIEQTEDLTQEVFLKIYRNISSLSLGQTPLGYLYTTARNTLIDFWRKKNLQIESSTEEFLNEVPDPTLSALDAAKIKEQSYLVNQCLAELSLDQRDVLTLRFAEDKSTKEIAEMLGKKEPAIRQLQVRGLRTLGKLFKGKYGIE